MTEENVNKLCAASYSHTHSCGELGAELLQASVTELSDDLITINVDQPHPPAAYSEEYPAQLSSSEPHPSPSPCSESQLASSSHDPSESHHSACSDHSSTHVEEHANNQQPLPLHESSNEPPLQMTTKSEPHTFMDSNSVNENEKTSVTKDQPLLIPSNQLLFDLD